MKSAVRSAVLPRAFLLQDRHSSAWTRTVAVIRIPRFNVREWIGRKAASRPEDPLAAFATEMEIEAARPHLSSS